jgi:ankyrin repeat protein
VIKKKGESYMISHIILIILMPFILIFVGLILLAIKLHQVGRERWAKYTYARVKTGFATADEKLSLLIYASCHGHVDMVQDVMSRNVDVNLQEHGETALDVAANYEIARLLLDAGAQINNEKIPGMLDNALKSNEVAFLRLLYEITPHIPYRQQLLLQALSNKRSEEIIRFLIENNAPIHEVDTQGWGDFEIRYAGGTALIYAIAHDYSPEIIRLMVTYGADVNYRDLQGKTPLMFVVGESNNVNALVDSGADVNAQDKQGKTPLMWLITAVDLEYYHDQFLSDNRELFWGSLESIKQLLERGADPAIKDNDNLTALDYAEIYHREDVAKLLREWQDR